MKLLSDEDFKDIFGPFFGAEIAAAATKLLFVVRLLVMIFVIWPVTVRLSIKDMNNLEILLIRVSPF